MALEERDIEHLQRIYDDLAGCLNRLDQALSDAKKAKLPTIWLHWDTIDSVILPKLIDWSAKAQTESVSEIAARRSGLKTRAQFESEKYQKYGPGKEPTASLTRSRVTKAEKPASSKSRKNK